MPKCQIHNGRYAYLLIVDGEKIAFQGSCSADYFEKHYRKLGYKVERTGDGSADK